MQLHPDDLVLESFLDPILDLPNFLNPNHVLNTLISPVYLIINSHLRHIAPNHNHCPTSTNTALRTSSFNMPKGGNKMDIKSDEQFMKMKSTIEAKMQSIFKNKRQETDK